jgi:ribosomal protein L31E
VRTVTGAVHWIIVRHRSVETAVVVTDQVSTEGYQTACAKAAAKSRVSVVNLTPGKSTS